MKLFFTSDHHFDHANILKYCERPFVSVEEMNSALIDNWNSVVNPGDQIYHLGDFSLGIKSLNIVSKLNGRKFLVAGNHDKLWTHLSPKRRVDPQVYVDAGFERVYPTGQVNYVLPYIGTVLLSHLPSVGDSHLEDRYKDLRPVSSRLILCGHVHNEWKHYKNNLNVGVDVWDYKPVSSDEVIDYVRRHSIPTRSVLGHRLD